ncbi:hypothetical protein MCOR09_009754 [Pyricularia oryzae]|nr:hypothetical protein MCOR09_009754 [Pyricularia oryzae]
MISRLVKEWTAKDDPERYFCERIWPTVRHDYAMLACCARETIIAALANHPRKPNVVLPIEDRTKEAGSISKSIHRRKVQLQGPGPIFREIHDLVGLRVIVSRPKDVGQLKELILTHFDVKLVSPFLRDRAAGDGSQDPTEFGEYEAWNYRVHLKPTANNKRFQDVLFEIQLVTWADAMFNILCHPLLYKQSAGELSVEERRLVDLYHGNVRQLSVLMDGLRNPLQLAQMAEGTEEHVSSPRDLLERARELAVRQQATTQDGSGLGTLPDFQDMVNTMRNLQVQLGLDMSSKRHEMFLKSLKFPGMNERRNIIEESHEETFRWALNDVGAASDESNSESDDSNSELDGSNSRLQWHRITDWLDSNHAIYWVSGKAGSGKSTFMKYLINHPTTERLLCQRRPGTRILSHFFWRAGSDLQKNIKGFFCNLLHQLANHNESILATLIQHVKDWQDKESHQDWSEKELRSLVKTVIESEPSPICVFIDGLDEVPVQQKLWEQVRMLAEFDKASVKLCVSSRPELRFENVLREYPRLRLQDLTHDDLQTFVKTALVDELYTKFASESSPAVEEFANCLLEKAAGVFLWIKLVTASLKRGLDNGDSLEFLEKRLIELPGDIIELYKEMWLRLDEDTKQYRQDGARYINCVLNSMILEREAHIDLYTVGMPLIVLEAAVNPGFRDKVLSRKAATGEGVTEQELAEIATKVQTRCAGLVELVETKRDYYFGDKGSFLELRSITSARIIHRSAYDFLTDQEDGQVIQDYDTSPASNRILDTSLGVLAYCIDGSPQRIVDEMEAALQPFRWLAGVEKAYFLRTFSALWHFYELGLFVPYTHLRFNPRRKPHLLAHLCNISSYRSYQHPAQTAFYMVEEIFRQHQMSSRDETGRSTAFASRLLRECFLLDARATYPYWFSFFCGHGANPHIRGILFEEYLEMRWSTRSECNHAIPVVPFASGSALWIFRGLGEKAYMLAPGWDKVFTEGLSVGERVPLMLTLYMEDSDGSGPRTRFGTRPAWYAVPKTKEKRFGVLLDVSIGYIIDRLLVRLKRFLKFGGTSRHRTFLDRLFSANRSRQGLPVVRPEISLAAVSSVTSANEEVPSDFLRVSAELEQRVLTIIDPYLDELWCFRLEKEAKISSGDEGDEEEFEEDVPYKEYGEGEEGFEGLKAAFGLLQRAFDDGSGDEKHVERLEIDIYEYLAQRQCGYAFEREIDMSDMEQRSPQMRTEWHENEAMERPDLYFPAGLTRTCAERWGWALSASTVQRF